MSPNPEPEDNSSVRSDTSDPAALLRLSDTFDKLVHSDDNGDKEQNQKDKTNEPKQPDEDSSKSAKDDVKATQEEKGMNNDDTIVETPPLPPPPPPTQAHGQNDQNNKQNTEDNGEKKQDEVQFASSSLSFRDVATDDASTPLLTPELLAVATVEQDEAEMTTKKTNEADNEHSSKEPATPGEQEDAEEETLNGEGDDHRNGESTVSSPDRSDRSNNSSSSSRVESLLQITKTPSLPSKKSTHEDDEEEDITKSSEEDDGDDDGDQKTSHSSARVMSYDDYEDESAFEDILGPLSPPKTKKSQTTTTPTLTENKEEEEKKQDDDSNNVQNNDMIAVVPSTPPKTKNDPIPPTVVSATQLHQNFETFMVDQGRKRVSIQNKVIHHNEQVADLQQRIRDLQAQLQQHNQELHRLRHEADTLDREELHRLQQRTMELKATPTPVTITNTSKQMTETGVDGLAVVSLVTDKEQPQGEGDKKTGADSGDIDNGRTTSSGGSAGEMVTESAWNTLERFMQCSPQHESP